jgi:hypothetical protein
MQPLLMMEQETEIAFGLESVALRADGTIGTIIHYAALLSPYKAPRPGARRKQAVKLLGNTYQTVRTTVTEALTAAQPQSRLENARRATPTAFRQDAAQEAAALDEKTLFGRRRLLLALRAWVRLHYAERPDRLRNVIRYLWAARRRDRLGTRDDRNAGALDRLHDRNLAERGVAADTRRSARFQSEGTPKPEEASCPEPATLDTSHSSTSSRDQRVRIRIVA